MSRTQSGRSRSLYERFPPSEPCSCALCVAYCRRPGWWTVEEACQALAVGLGGRMMLEISPERTFGVLAPAFYGCEHGFAVNEQAGRGCNFLKTERCELFASGLQPLECRFCHHERAGQGPLCHAALERDWQRQAGQALVERWAKEFGLWKACKRLLIPTQVIPAG
jgi:hypothetical protein